MSKLTKREAKAHAEAMALVRAGRRLTMDEREYVLANYHEGATNVNSQAGAFFTPAGLANDFSLEVGPGRILDLCAGIGRLSLACSYRLPARYEKPSTFVCVEVNPEYAEVGRAVFPEASWICASAFDTPKYQDQGPFDVVISNPPFGKIKAEGYTGGYTGAEFEYRLIEHASRLARYGVFIIPQQSAPFRYSGQPYYRPEESAKAKKFREQTGILMEANCGIDTSTYRDEWRGVSPICEIVCCEFSGACVGPS